MNKKFQIFVSSTYSDLKSERQACVEAILTAGHIPAGMELFSAGDESQLDIIKRWIDESDIYMLLLGGRYGSIEPKSGLSYTEIEYRYAIDSGKPYFALIMQEDYLNDRLKNEGKQVLELDNRPKYDEFRKLVLSKISKFFNNTDQLKLSILQALLDIQNRHTLSGWMRSEDTIDSAKVLNQIAELTLVNRELQRQLAELQAIRMLEQNSNENLIDILPNEAKLLLIQGSQDESGLIIMTTHDRIIYTNNNKFPNTNSPRSIAFFESAFSVLEENNLIVSVETTGESEYYRLTKSGYETADKLQIR